MDHTATTFLLNPRGELLVLYPFGTAPSDISQDLRVLFEI
jgi:cytochrome oxidase Cu insertion factor (SCO1/SenC/PrrC family)